MKWNPKKFWKKPKFKKEMTTGSPEKCLPECDDDWTWIEWRIFQVFYTAAFVPPKILEFAARISRLETAEGYERLSPHQTTITGNERQKNSQKLPRKFENYTGLQLPTLFGLEYPAISHVELMCGMWLHNTQYKASNPLEFRMNFETSVFILELIKILGGAVRMKDRRNNGMKTKLDQRLQLFTSKRLTIQALSDSSFEPATKLEALDLHCNE